MEQRRSAAAQPAASDSASSRSPSSLSPASTATWAATRLTISSASLSPPTAPIQRIGLLIEASPRSRLDWTGERKYSKGPGKPSGYAPRAARRFQTHGSDFKRPRRLQARGRSPSGRDELEASAGASERTVLEIPRGGAGGKSAGFGAKRGGLSAPQRQWQAHAVPRGRLAEAAQSAFRRARHGAVPTKRNRSWREAIMG